MMEAMNSRGARVKRVTAADVARALGLSRATVGFVLNNTPGQTIPEQTRRRVLAEAERLGYRPHTAARALASGRSHIVLVVLPDWPIDYSLRRHLEEAPTTSQLCTRRSARSRGLPGAVTEDQSCQRIPARMKLCTN